jgi:hypothetical protein
VVVLAAAVMVTSDSSEVGVDGKPIKKGRGVEFDIPVERSERRGELLVRACSDIRA